MSDGIVEIHGRDYQTVAYRLKALRNEHVDWSITTEMLSADDDGTVFKASIADSQGRVIATGHAEEKRSASQINQSAAIENCETSAVGRALANAGYLGVDIASADEMEENRSEQIVQYFIRYLDKVREHWDDIHKFKLACREGKRAEASPLLVRRVGEDDMRILWRAPTKGSVFETVERDKSGTGRDEDEAPSHELTDHPKMQS